MNLNCTECENNYLLKIFNRCMEKYNRTNESLVEFDKICLRSGDPRSSLTIIRSMNNNACSECKKYRQYYEK